MTKTCIWAIFAYLPNLKPETFYEVGRVFVDRFNLTRTLHENIHFGEYEKYSVSQDSYIKLYMNYYEEDEECVYEGYPRETVIVHLYSKRLGHPVIRHLLESPDVYRLVEPIVIFGGSGRDYVEHYAGWGPVPEAFL